MTTPRIHIDNPFALLMDPESIFRAIEGSERLERLHSRVCRPLDKPLLPHAPAEAAATFDQAVDTTEDEFLFDDLPGEAI